MSKSSEANFATSMRGNADFIERISTWLKTTPGKVSALLSLVVVGSALCGASSWHVWSAYYHTATQTGQEAAVNLVAADRLHAESLSAQQAALRWCGSGTPQSWQQYQEEIATVQKEVSFLASSISRPEERPAAAEIMTLLGDYREAVGMAAGKGGPQAGATTARMQQKLAAATERLITAKEQQLTAGYQQHMEHQRRLLIIFGAGILALLTPLVWLQVYLAKKTRRMFNIGLLLGSLATVGFACHSANALYGMDTLLKTVQQKSLPQVRLLWHQKEAAVVKKDVSSISSRAEPGKDAALQAAHDKLDAQLNRLPALVRLMPALLCCTICLVLFGAFYGTRNRLREYRFTK